MTTPPLSCCYRDIKMIAQSRDLFLAQGLQFSCETMLHKQGHPFLWPKRLLCVFLHAGAMCNTTCPYRALQWSILLCLCDSYTHGHISSCLMLHSLHRPLKVSVVYFNCQWLSRVSTTCPSHWSCQGLNRRPPACKADASPMKHPSSFIVPNPSSFIFAYLDFSHHHHNLFMHAVIEEGHWMPLLFCSKLWVKNHFGEIKKTPPRSLKGK